TGAAGAALRASWKCAATGAAARTATAATPTSFFLSANTDGIGDDDAARARPARQDHPVPAGAEVVGAEGVPAAPAPALVHVLHAEARASRVEHDERRRRRAVACGGPVGVDSLRRRGREVEVERRAVAHGRGAG